MNDEDDLFSRVKGMEKQNVNMTIDKLLFTKLETYKKKHKIKSMSGMVNEMLWDWIKNEK